MKLQTTVDEADKEGGRQRVGRWRAAARWGGGGVVVYGGCWGQFCCCMYVEGK